MQQKSFLGHNPIGFHRIAYTEWGSDDKRTPVLCVHGLVRNGRDFDRLASSLQDKSRVFCPDMAGRGQSEWLSQPDFYNNFQYMADITTLLARIGDTVDWVGTSMGGILGIYAASQTHSPVRRLVINDVGPFIPAAALRRIGTYVGVMPEFIDVAGAERYLRQIYSPFGLTADKDWRDLADRSVRTLLNGKLTLAHDPAIGRAFATIENDVDFWDIYDRITCPVLLLRGAQSDILSHETAQQMTQRGPKATLVEFPNIGHAPALIDAGQIKLIADFLHS